MRSIVLLFLSMMVAAAPVTAQRQTDEIKLDKGTLKVTPVMHASLELSWNDKTIYVDPTGNPGLYDGLALPNINELPAATTNQP